MNCVVCGAKDHACGGSTTTRGIDENILTVRESMMPKRDNMVRVDRGDGILVNMTKEEQDNFEAANADRSDRTTVYNYAIETQQLTPSSPPPGDRVVSSRTLRRPPTSRPTPESTVSPAPPTAPDTDSDEEEKD